MVMYAYSAWGIPLRYLKGRRPRYKKRDLRRKVVPCKENMLDLCTHKICKEKWDEANV